VYIGYTDRCINGVIKTLFNSFVFRTQDTDILERVTVGRRVYYRRGVNFNQLADDEAVTELARRLFN
jgi:hypothetical protein